MAFTVEQLIEGHQEPVTVFPDTPAQRALELMVEYDFSQLPVVDAKNKPLGIVTGDSILRALNNFGIPLTDLQVSHAIVKVDQYSPDEDLFDLLDDLKNTYAVLVVHSDGTLKSIVTSYDTTEYFRRRAEDMMYVEDIESTIKDFIRIAFGGADETDPKAMAKVIAEIEGPDLNKKFRNAINYYLGVSSKSKPDINEDVLDQAFERYFSGKHSQKSLDDLTLHEYIELLLHKSKRASFNSVFKLKPEAVRNLLHGVRETRNALAHFHGEISSKQRDQLRFCAQWLEYHRSAVLNAFQSGAAATESQQGTASLQLTYTVPGPNDDEIVPVEEGVVPNDSRYAPLAIWLQKQPLNQETIPLTFRQVEEIIGESLPASARKHRAWWSNHLEFNPQARQWWEVGWRVATVRMTEEIVVFARVEERKKAYIKFFSSLLDQLASRRAFPMKPLSPDGQNWITIASLPTSGRKVATVAFSFARHKRFRVELYIDTGNAQENKEAFDKLLVRREFIEAEVGSPLSWERLEDARASRVALYHAGSITDSSEEELARLREWAVDGMIRLHKVMDEQLSEVL